MQETRVRSLGGEDPLEEEMATPYSILAWKIPWMEEPGGCRQRSGKELDTSELARMKEYRERQNTSSVAQSILGEGSGHGFRKRRGTRDQVANMRWIREKAREFQKNIYLCFIDR